jgi:hypothetical protein
MDTLDFYNSETPANGFKLQLDCRSAGRNSEAFVEFWLDPGSLKLCFDLDQGQPSKRSISLEKTKYSLVSNGSASASPAGIGPPQELISSANRMGVRFFSKLGRLPGRGMKAKFKIGNTRGLLRFAPRFP